MSPSRGVCTRSASGRSSAAPVPRRPALGDQPSRGDVGLGFAGAGRGASAQPRQLGASQVAPLALGGGLPLGPLGPGLEVGGVAAIVHVGPPAIELEDAGGQPVEHVAVVGHEDQPAAEAGEALLEPGDGVHVEVVGRLVQDQQVALARLPHRRQCPGEGGALGLAARQAADVGIGEGGHAHPVEQGGASASHVSPTAWRTVPSGRAAAWSRATTRATTPAADDAALGLDHAGQHAEQRRLP